MEGYEEVDHILVEHEKDREPRSQANWTQDHVDRKLVVTHMAQPEAIQLLGQHNIALEEKLLW